MDFLSGFNPGDWLKWGALGGWALTVVLWYLERKATTRRLGDLIKMQIAATEKTTDALLAVATQDKE